MREDGTFVFLLFVSGEVGRANAQPIRQWRIEGAELQRAQARSAFGESYQFKLSLLADGTDTLPIAAADIVCRFEPADGRDPVYAGQISSIQLGRRVLVPQPTWRHQTQPPAAPVRGCDASDIQRQTRGLATAAKRTVTQRGDVGVL